MCGRRWLDGERAVADVIIWALVGVKAGDVVPGGSRAGSAATLPWRNEECSDA